jgi:type IX secretion system PorP/SprF family membrane protein
MATIACVLTLTGIPARGQSDVRLNHHWLYRLDNNPATIKNSGYIEVVGLTRNQWIGFDGAPQTQTVAISGFYDAINSGFGLVALNDKIGYTQRLNFKVLYSYNFLLNETSMITLGVSGGMLKSSLDRDKILVNDDIIDPELITYIADDRIKPDVDFGLNYTYRVNEDEDDPLFQIGASVTHLNQLMNTEKYKLSCNYNAYTSFNFRLGSSVKLLPGASFSYRQNISSLELNAMFLISAPRIKRLWFGGSFKPQGNGAALFAGFNISEAIGLGYSTDLTYSSVGRQSRSSHEIMLVLRIANSRDDNCPAYHSRRQTRYNSRYNNFVM